MPNYYLDELMRRIARYLAKTKMSRTDFGMASAGTPNLMSRMAARKVHWLTIEAVVKYLDKNGG